jgi:peptide/nickel transport system substrate-binding protein
VKRRSLLAGAAGFGLARSILPAPAIAAPAGSRTLVFVPQANLTSLDPVWTTATVTRNYAFLVYDTLYGLDADLKPHPQMAAGHTVDQDGLRWTIKLRDGLFFHDGTPVTSKDCQASLARWMKRDSVGQTLAARLDAMETPDDKTIVFRLKKSFAPLPFALAKTQPSPPVIMPARIAETDPYKQITEAVGSGPFRFLKDEYVSGSLAAFAKFDKYTPRDDAPSFSAGAKRALVDRIEWKIIPEASTQANALKSGEVDWVEIPLPDLLPMLKRDSSVVVEKLDPIGLYPVLRFNHLQGPTTNLGLRQAILACIDQREVMQAIMGDDASAYHVPVGCFIKGTASENNAAMERLGGHKSEAELKEMVKASGYSGEKVLLMHPTDQPFYDAMTQVAAASMKKIGINVDDSAMDWGTVVQRRASKQPLDKGGWSLFCTSFPAADYLDPLSAPAIRGNGGAAWFGWPTDEKIETLRDQWIDTDDAAKEKQLATEIQQEVFTQALYVPLGQYFQSAAWRKNITGHLKGPVPVFWNVQKG